MTYALWTVQILLMLLFVFSGSMKLIMPFEEMTAEFYLPEFLLRFIGVAEVLGGLGLVLPGLFRIRRELTPLAALGLSIIMIGAVVISVMSMGAMLALIPLVVLLLTAFVGYGRWKRGSGTQTSISGGEPARM